MSLGAEHGERPRQHPRAIKRIPVRRGKGATANPASTLAKPIAPHLAAAREILTAIAQDLLTAGDHSFAEIRAEYQEWCARMHIADVTDRMLAAWLVDEGLTRRRVGRAKTTTYTKSAA